MSISWPDESLFEPFTVFETTYKTVSAHDIKAAVLIPKNLKPGPHPVIIQIHGGFFATAHSLFAPFFPIWACNLAVEHSAIIVSPDYRLLPTENGVKDILEDLEDFWQWTRSSLQSVIDEKAPGHALNLSQTLLTGNSAGGYCAVQLALSHPDEISALGVVFPAMDLYDPIFATGPSKGDPTVMRFPEAEIPTKEDTIAWIEESRKTVATKAGFERTPFCVAATQHGLIAKTVFDPKGLKLEEFNPVKRMQSGAKLPQRVWLMHGDDDTVVHIRTSHLFSKVLQETQPQTTLRYDVVPGRDHAFDVDMETWEDIYPSAMDFLRSGWLE
ncbi:unnamed protein product [Clonostachys rosea]|uniref:Alpha/beta hydrolase fold-3 domain-containing protein n=1 Tax=Bionectria ochroleuca TaxID=29856 RepID=A0ABY6TPH8_BIOOC|nr:unnamed protein product [Clonostachys rosea]